MQDALRVWVDEKLVEAGIARIGPFDTVVDRSWGAVYRTDTTAGPVWLKAPTRVGQFEIGLIDVIGKVVPDVVLAPLAVDRERGWVLLPDGGPVLGRSHADIAVADLASAMSRYASAQRRLEPHVDALLAVGVADMRPTVMPARFTEALHAAGTYAAGHPDREAAVTRVSALADVFRARCAELAASPVSASLDHNDLHALNMFGRPGDAESMRFFDWGDAVIAHPFASLLVPLNIASASGPAAVEALRTAYLAPYADLAAKADLIATVDLACWVGKVARALTWHRALAVGSEFAEAPFEHVVALLQPGFTVD